MSSKYIKNIQELCGVDGIAYMVIVKEDFIDKLPDKIRKSLETIKYDDGVVIKGLYRGKYISLLPEGILLLKNISSKTELKKIINDLIESNK